MTNLQKAFLAAVVKSLLRGKSLIQAILAFWVKPMTVNVRKSTSCKTLQEFLKEAEAALLGPVRGQGLQKLAADLKKQFLERSQEHGQCMLPSFNHQLPFGSECGEYVALDVGGSTLRVAVVALRGRPADGSGRQSEIVSLRSFHIGKDIKNLEGMRFFTWMAQRIGQVLTETGKHEHSVEKPLPVACAWSFPIEQTSLGAGKLLPMGKAFLADKGLLGKDLGEVIKQSCKDQNLHIELRAILNDASACLLSRAYSHTSTRFGLILGTGVNLAAYLPVTSIGSTKFGARSQDWFDEASHVIVNTELGMFGHSILPLTRWDRTLTEHHPRPNFQPLEQLVSGMYLGEIVRLALLEAIESTGLLGGVVPPSLNARYSLGTDTISMIEGDTSSDMKSAIQVFLERHPSPHRPAASDLVAIKAISSLVSKRSCALVAASIFALWDLRRDHEQRAVNCLPVSLSERERVEDDTNSECTTVAFNGSVIENYPGYLDSCQGYLDDLMESKTLPGSQSIILVPTKESSLTGAAVALSCIEHSNSESLRS